MVNSYLKSSEVWEQMDSLDYFVSFLSSGALLFFTGAYPNRGTSKKHRFVLNSFSKKSMILT